MARPVCLLILVMLSTTSPASSGEAVDGAIRRALPYVRERGKWWADEKGCVSCHRTTFTTWTLSAARNAGFEVDGDQLADMEK